MSRTFSATTKQAMLASETGEGYLTLISISHPELDGVLRVVCNTEDIVSRGDTFVAYPFEMTLPSDEEEAPPAARVTIDNIDLQVANTLRSINSPATFLMEIVRIEDLDTVEETFSNFQLRNIDGDLMQINGDLTIEDMTSEPFPYLKFGPKRFRGLYA